VFIAGLFFRTDFLVVLRVSLAVAAQVLQQAAAFHFTITVPRSASGGTPRNPSSRRSASINAIA
jgi:hypothetical protein